MALVLADRVLEQTSTAGTGTLTLTGAVNKYQSFAVIGNGNTTYYTIFHQTLNQWEVGIGTYTAVGTTLSRDTVLASSNANALVNFGVGTKYVFADYPAGKAVYQDASGNVTVAGTATFGSFIPTSSTLPTNGMYLPLASTLAWSVGSAEGMRLGTTGLLIGTTTPVTNSKLVIGSADITVNGVTIGKGASNIFANTALGVNALRFVTTGSSNTGVGYTSLSSVTTGGNNTGLGEGALLLNVTGNFNTGLGRAALYSCVGSQNTGVGYQALSQLTSGAGNTAVGMNSANAITTGSYNTILGSYNGNQGGLDIRTAGNYIVLSDGVGNPRWIVDGNGIAGYGPSTGGTVTQTGSRTTGVTIAKSTGSITLVSAAGTTAWQSFTVTNGFVSAADTIHVVQQSGTDLYQIFVTNVSAGSFRITFATTGGTTTEQPVFNFTVIKGQTI